MKSKRIQLVVTTELWEILNAKAQSEEKSVNAYVTDILATHLHVGSRTIPEVATQLGVSTKTIYRYIDEGKLKAIKRAGRWEIPQDEVVRLTRK